MSIITKLSANEFWGLPLAVLTTCMTVSMSILPATAATITAQETDSFTITGDVGRNEYVLKYRVSIEDATPPEELVKVTPLMQCAGRDIPANRITAVKVDNFNWDVTIRLFAITGTVDVNCRLTTVAEEKFKNKIIKKNITVEKNGVADPGNTPPLPGFEFSSKSSGFYTLFNESNESWTVNRLLVRINKSELDLDSFDLENPDSLMWDFEITTPFFLPAGDSLEIPLGQELLADPNLFSQAFIENVGNSTGITVKTIQQHQQEAVPESSFPLGLLTVGALGAGSTLQRKQNPDKSTEKETTKPS